MKSNHKTPILLLALAFGSMTLQGLRAQDANNLAKDPSFEEEGNPAGAPAWSGVLRGSDSGTPDGVSFTIVNENAQDGKQAAQIEILQGANPSKALAEWTQMIPVRPGTRYYFSVYSLSEIRKGWVNVVVEEKMSNRVHADYGAERPSAHVAQANPDEGAADGYRLMECTFETGPETAFVTLSLRLQEGLDGRALFDNVTLIEL